MQGLFSKYGKKWDRTKETESEKNIYYKTETTAIHPHLKQKSPRWNKMKKIHTNDEKRMHASVRRWKQQQKKEKILLKE